MGLFSKKPKIVKNIYGGAWGHLVQDHKITVGTLEDDFRCVDKGGVVDGGMPVTFLRVFRLSEVANKGVTVSGWETFDQHPELVLFEGYITPKNEARLERKRA